MTDAILRAGAEGGEAAAPARDTLCTCCDLPVDTCGTAWATRVGADLKNIDTTVAARLAGHPPDAHATSAEMPLDDPRIAPWLRTIIDEDGAA